MLRAYIVSTGTELLLGSTADTNSLFLSQRLTELGIKVEGKVIVGDDGRDIREAFEQGLRRADMVISSGGLGPTNDDLTKDMACRVMNCQAVLVEEEAERVKAYFMKRGRPMPPSNMKQAMFPPEAVILKNDRGTAPGMYLRKDSKLIALLPGPPHEMRSMYLNELEPLLISDYALSKQSSAHRIIKVFGPGESQVEVILGELIEKPQGYNMALTAKAGEIHIGIQVFEQEQTRRQQRLDEITAQVKARLGPHVFGIDQDSLLNTTVSSLIQKGKTIAVAESCTGGLLSKILTDLPGSSAYFWGGVVSYSNEAKQRLLGVSRDVLDNFGAVSRESAEAMVRGLVDRSGTDLGAAVTGIAGPATGSEEKSVGLVYIAVLYGNSCTVKEVRLGGQRDMVRTLAAKSALDTVRRILMAEEME
ncbi:MAG: competence/damage-inducible protein A [Syntrophomonadaceae bacterium]|nr:competence/damage-inducible protein A [Syntrophomonadaceae bacterium]